MPKFPYYVVYPANNGYETGIYRNYRRAAEATSGNPGDNGNRKGCNSWEEASQHYRARSGQTPHCIDWYDKSPDDIDPKQVEMEMGDKNLLKVKVPISSARSTGEQFNNAYFVDTSAIGRWGEQFAYYYLKGHFLKKYEHSTAEELKEGYTIRHEGVKLAEIHWHNITSESYKSPDITVTENGDVSYWELKATTLSDKYDIPITESEKRFARENGERYHLVRVTHVGRSNAQIYDFGNPFLIPSVQQNPGIEPLSDHIQRLNSDQASTAILDMEFAKVQSIIIRGECNGHAECHDALGKITGCVYLRVLDGGGGRVFIYRKVKRKIRAKLLELESNHPYRNALALLHGVTKADIAIHVRGDVNERTIQEALEKALSQNH